MGFFAIIRDDTGRKYSIRRCHLNYWIVPRYFHPHKYLLDVGLLLKLENESSTTLPLCVNLTLPFGTDDKAFTDLANKLEDTNTCELVFGEPVSRDSDNKITVESYENPTFRVAHFVRESSKRNKELSGSKYSYWQLQVSCEENDDYIYVRARFRINQTGQVWRWEPSMFFREGALADLRISDVRGTVSNWSDFTSRILKIPYLNLILVAPVRLETGYHNPDFKYVRLLEPKKWKNYLGFSPSQKLANYHWKYPHNISQANPFHAYLCLKYGSNSNSFIQSLKSAGLLFILFSILAFLFDASPSWQVTMINHLKNTSSIVLKSIYAIGGYNLISILLDVKIFRNIGTKIWHFLRGL